MELAKAKTPTLPPDWTAARIARYATKLGLFILVPGLHQIACKRRILGGLLFMLFAVSEFAFSNAPAGGNFDYTYSFALFFKLSDAAFYFTWLLLAFDLKNLESRDLTLGSLVLVFCLAVIHFSPLHNNRFLLFHIEQANTACPAFCKFDIVEWERNDPKNVNYSKGDYVVLGNNYSTPYYTTKILAGPVTEFCARDNGVSLGLPYDNEFCTLLDTGAWDDEPLMDNSWKTYWGKNHYYLYDFLIPRRANLEFTNIAARNFSMMSRFEPVGVRPKKIGNLREYYIYSDEVTDLVGTALLAVYQWTGLNLFGWSESTM